MNIALFEPYSPELLRGNSISAERLSHSLTRCGVNVRCFSLHDISNRRLLLKQLHSFKPDLLHGFHACKAGPLVKTLSGNLNKPYVISMRGTDANEDALKKPACRTMNLVLKDAQKVVVFHSAMKKTLLEKFPVLKNKVKIISQGIDVRISQEKKRFAGKSNITTFGYAGGLRRLKGVHVLMSALKEIHKVYPAIQLHIAGPVIEKAYARKILKEVNNNPWMEYLGEIPHKKIASFYNNIDIYINASTSEGTSNSILEAMEFQKCVLASDMEGNRAVIKNGKNGFLFTSRENLIKKAGYLISHRTLRNRAGKRAYKYARHHHSAAQEAKHYEHLYSECLT